MAFSMEGGKGCEVMLVVVVEEEIEEKEICSRDESSSWMRVLQEAWSLMAWLKVKSKATCPPSAPPLPLLLR
jgi:hypothetical protein